MKHVFTFIVMLLSIASYAQHCPELGPDQILPCGVGSTTLTADLSQCGAGNNPNQTTAYSVANIPYLAPANTGTSLFMSDDSQQGPFQIGFNFCFFGQTYTQFYVGSNGWISFSPGQPTTFTTQTVPTTNALVPKNCVMGPWQDWHPGVGGQIKYQVQGTAPCRKLVVSWINMPMFLCTTTTGTFHIILYESSNYIENHIQSKQYCSWQGGTATEAVHDITGTTAVAVPGRNSTVWTATNDAWRWTPAGPTVTPTLTWYQVGNPNPIGTGPTLNVTPPAGGAQYTCHLVYPTCNAGWSTCNASGTALGPDTVLVVPGPPNLPTPTVIPFNPSCAGSCDGLISVMTNGGTGVQTISWNGPQTGFNPMNLCAGTYSFTITDAAGCTVSGITTLTNPAIPVIGPITYSDTICFQSANEIYTVPQQSGYTYQWSSINNSITGNGTNVIAIDWSSFNAGFMPGAVMVTGYNANGCPSLPLSIDLTIFEVIPVITPIGPFCEYDEFVTVPCFPTSVNSSLVGTGVVGLDFYPGNAVGTNDIIYTYTQSGCVFDDTISVTVYPQPALDSITPYNPFYEICIGDSVTTSFSALSNLPGYNEWTYINNTYQQDDLTISFNAEGMFPLSVIHYANGCASPQQDIMITVEHCPEMLFYIPNSFTPDGNEHNQTWLPVFTNGFDPYNYHLQVYNRWGEVIFETWNATEGWDGTYGVQNCQDGTYTYVVQFAEYDSSNEHVIKGHFGLIR